MDYTGTFTYNTQNLMVTSDNVMLAMIYAGIFFILVFVARSIGMYIVGLFLLRESNKKIANKKKVLNDLILMRDIQTELEKEIEQATLKSAFQN